MDGHGLGRIMSLWDRKRSHPIRTIAILLLVSMVSCSVVIHFYRPASKPRSEWINKWLVTPTCQLLCWENITPGITTIPESKERLFQIANIINISGPKAGPFGTAELSWNFENHGGSGSIKSEPEDNGIVSKIFLAPDGEPKLTVDEVIQKFGEPDLIQVYDCRSNQCMVRIINTDRGFYIESLLTKNFI